MQLLLRADDPHVAWKEVATGAPYTSVGSRGSCGYHGPWQDSDQRRRSQTAQVHTPALPHSVISPVGWKEECLPPMVAVRTPRVSRCEVFSACLAGST